MLDSPPSIMDLHNHETNHDQNHFHSSFYSIFTSMRPCPFYGTISTRSLTMTYQEKPYTIQLLNHPLYLVFEFSWSFLYFYPWACSYCRQIPTDLFDQTRIMLGF